MMFCRLQRPGEKFRKTTRFGIQVEKNKQMDRF
jgi:hypothetical protein